MVGSGHGRGGGGDARPSVVSAATAADQEKMAYDAKLSAVPALMVALTAGAVGDTAANNGSESSNYNKRCMTKALFGDLKVKTTVRRVGWKQKWHPKRVSKPVVSVAAPAPPCRAELPLQLQHPDDWAQRLAGLQCPFTWQQCQPVNEVDCTYRKITLLLHASDFEVVMDLVLLSFSLHCNGHRAEARARLADGYALLLPQLDRGCCMLRIYREALRHVLDATWAGLLAAAGGEDPLLRAFVQRVKPFARLGRRQQAAVVAVQSFCVGANDANGAVLLLRKAIDLAPKEGMWPSMLASKLLVLRECNLCCVRYQDVVALLEDSYRLRPTASSATQLAKVLARGKEADKARAQLLLSRALAFHPDIPGVLLKAIDVQVLLLRKDPGRARAVRADADIEALVRRALAAAGPGRRGSFVVNYKLAAALTRHGWRKRGRELYDAAYYIDPAAYGFMGQRQTLLIKNPRAKAKCLKSVSSSSGSPGEGDAAERTV